MKRILILTAGLCMTVLAAPSQAQTSEYENMILGQSMEARIGITIPFGGDGSSKASEPQLQLIGRRTGASRRSLDWAMKPDGGQDNYVETRLALTLSETPVLRLNDQEFYEFGSEQAQLGGGVETVGKVILVTAVVAGMVILVALAKVAACGGDGEDDKC